MTPAEIRLAALAKLAHVKSPAVEQRMAEEFRRAKAALNAGDSPDAASEALSVLKLLVPRFHMAILPLLAAFVRSAAMRSLHVSAPTAPVPIEAGADGLEEEARSSAEALVIQAVDVAMSMRFVHTAELLTFLLDLARARSDSVRRKAENALQQLVTLDLEYFRSHPSDGAGPQRIVVERLSLLGEDELQHHAPLITKLLGCMLSAAMDSSSQTSYRTIELRRGAVSSAGGVAEMRESAIALAKRLYWLKDSVDARKSVLQLLDGATRRDGPARDDATAAMFEANAINVLEFLKELVQTEALPLLQSIEHQSYWDFYHASSDAVKRRALEVRDALDRHGEYQIYKQLIGFEGIFGNWEDLKRSDGSWNATDALRRAAADRFIEEIDEANRTAWRERILEYSKTRSDDLATFPVFFSFLESVGARRPHLAMELLTNHFTAIEAFMIPLMRGLWASEHAANLDSLVADMLSRREHLSAIARSLYGTHPPRIALLEDVVQRASESDDRPALVDAMGVAASLHTIDGADTRRAFMDALRALARHDDPQWANSIWIAKDLARMSASLDPADKTELANALVMVPEVNYQSERLLSAVSNEDVQVILSFFDARLIHDLRLTARDRWFDEQERFEAIPNRLHNLAVVLAKEPSLLLRMLRKHFDRPDARTLFSYRAATLVRVVFNELAPALADELLNYAAGGSKADIAFVIAILRTYEGDAAIYDVCKGIVKNVPERSRAWSEVAAAIETTGMVIGEFGMARALERKLQDIDAWKFDPDVRVQAFAEWISEALVKQISQERERAEQGLALRKYRYGDEADEA